MRNKPRHPTKRARPSLIDVAQLAGVSHQTVSRVVNGHPSVRPETLERVTRAMRHLKYQPNSAARALVTGRSQTIGVICLDTPLHGPTSVLFSLEQAAREAGFFVSISAVETLNADSIRLAISRFQQQALAGVVIVSPLVLDGRQYELNLDIPTIGIWGPSAAHIPLVGLGHQAAGAARATEHLLGLGHRNVFHVAGPPGWLGSDARIGAWQKVLMDHGIEPPAIITGDWSAQSGYEAGKQIARSTNATAVFCANDQMALGLMRALREAEKRVPEDVSVVGFDDIPDAAFYIPSLTTVEQDFHLLGRQGMALLLREMGKGKGGGAEPLILPSRLIVRESTAPPAPFLNHFRL